MSFTVDTRNLDTMWRSANLKLWNMADDEFDFVRSGVTVHSFHNQLHAAHADISMAISDFGYTKTKWSMLMKLYFNQQSYVMLVERIKQYRSNPKGKRYVVDIPLSFNQRMNASGECLMGMTVRYSEKLGWECEVMTRASESVSRWGVDLVFIHVLLREIGKELDFTPHDVMVHWNSASMFQSILTVPLFICRQPGGEELLRGDRPLKSQWQEAVRKRYRKAFDVLGGRSYSNYKSQQRVVKAYDALHGRLKPKDLLTADKLQLPKITCQLPEDFFHKGGFK